MTVNQDQLVKKIQSVVAASPELQKQLAAVSSAEEVASLLSATLASPVSVSDLQSLSSSMQPELTDEQLEVVTGGRLAIILSIMTAGIGCAIASAIGEIGGKGGCRSDLSH